MPSSCPQTHFWYILGLLRAGVGCVVRYDERRGRLRQHIAATITTTTAIVSRQHHQRRPAPGRTGNKDKNGQRGREGGKGRKNGKCDNQARGRRKINRLEARADATQSRNKGPRSRQKTTSSGVDQDSVRLLRPVNARRDGNGACRLTTTEQKKKKKRKKSLTSTPPMSRPQQNDPERLPSTPATHKRVGQPLPTQFFSLVSTANRPKSMNTPAEPTVETHPPTFFASPRIKRETKEKTSHKKSWCAV